MYQEKQSITHLITLLTTSVCHEKGETTRRMRRNRLGGVPQSAKSGQAEHAIRVQRYVLRTPRLVFFSIPPFLCVFLTVPTTVAHDAVTVPRRRPRMPSLTCGTETPCSVFEQDLYPHTHLHVERDSLGGGCRRPAAVVSLEGVLRAVVRAEGLKRLP